LSTSPTFLIATRLPVTASSADATLRGGEERGGVAGAWQSSAARARQQRGGSAHQPYAPPPRCRSDE
jgi:hypothetical protein